MPRYVVLAFFQEDDDVELLENPDGGRIFLSEGDADDAAAEHAADNHAAYRFVEVE